MQYVASFFLAAALGAGLAILAGDPIVGSVGALTVFIGLSVDCRRADLRRAKIESRLRRLCGDRA